MHKLSMISSVLRVKFHSKSKTIRKGRQPAGWPAQSVKKLAGTADGKIETFEIRAKKTQAATKALRFVNLLKQGGVFRSTQHSPNCTQWSAEEFYHSFYWEQRVLKYYSHKRLKSHLSVQPAADWLHQGSHPPPRCRALQTWGGYHPSLPRCCLSISWWIAAVCSQEF